MFPLIVLGVLLGAVIVSIVVLARAPKVADRIIEENRERERQVDPMPPLEPKKEAEPKIDPKKEPPKPKVDTELERRKGIYKRLQIAYAEVDAEAEKKFGKKPTKSDPLGDQLKWEVFARAGRDKVLEQLRNDGIFFDEVQAIVKEGDEKSWPKK